DFGGRLGVSAAILGVAASPADGLPPGISRKSELGFKTFAVPAEPMFATDAGLADNFRASPPFEVSIESVVEEVGVQSGAETVPTGLGSRICDPRGSCVAARTDAVGVSIAVATGVADETPTPERVAPTSAGALAGSGALTGAAGALASTACLSTPTRAGCVLSGIKGGPASPGAGAGPEASGVSRVLAT